MSTGEREKYENRNGIMAIDILSHPFVKGLEAEIKLLRILLGLKTVRVKELEESITNFLGEN